MQHSSIELVILFFFFNQNPVGGKYLHITSPSPLNFLIIIHNFYMMYYYRVTTRADLATLWLKELKEICHP